MTVPVKVSNDPDEWIERVSQVISRASSRADRVFFPFAFDSSPSNLILDTVHRSKHVATCQNDK